MISKINHYKIKCDHSHCSNEEIIFCEEISSENLSGMNKILTDDLNSDLIAEAIRKAGWSMNQLSRDQEARKNRQTVNCIVCQKEYYPGLSDDKDRPRDKTGKLIRISMADIQNYCSKPCEKEYWKKNNVKYK